VTKSEAIFVTYR